MEKSDTLLVPKPAIAWFGPPVSESDGDDSLAIPGRCVCGLLAPGSTFRPGPDMAGWMVTVDVTDRVA